MRRLATRFVGIAAALAMTTGTAFAVANPGNNGNAGSAPGQANAAANCGKAISQTPLPEETGNANDAKQFGGGGGVTNCDHFFQNTGQIGPN